MRRRRGTERNAAGEGTRSTERSQGKRVRRPWVRLTRPEGCGKPRPPARSGRSAAADRS
jgi:hypothetical protein